MSLGTRLTLKTAVLVLAVVVVAGVALWGLGGLNRDLDAALREYDRLAKAYALLSDIEQARNTARNRSDQPLLIERALLRPVLYLKAAPEPSALSDKLRAALVSDLSRALAALDEQDDTVDATLRVLGPINTAINRLAAEIDDTSARIRAIEANATEHRRRVVLGVGVTAAIAALLAIVVGVWQYAAVMRPLRRLQRGVERLASGDFADRLRSAGDREFVQLADDFNQMADDLAALYQQLEDKVRLRSAQLAQSERLASVGFLAAGVAHEINNPLAIIAGEAELALQALPARSDADDAPRRALGTIRDEAFRCKAITQKLLSLARPGSGTREPVDLNEVAAGVRDLVRALPQHDGRRVDLKTTPDAWALTDASQVKQVLLNLVINALEAVRPGDGRVHLIVERSPEHACIMVHDNGKGISDEALARIFEPFYTEKKSPTTPGLGLGLSISHAIVEDLGGQLTAASDGQGRGSRFTIELPTSR
ncbi:MAG: sensor histidine kinase [Phycisphaeraceae bacterium]